MPLLTSGRNHIAADLMGESVTEFNNANSYLCVGNSSTAFSAAHTDLQGGSKTRKAMDATYPQRSTNVLTFKATFATGDANHAWDEWGVANASTAGTLLNRKVEALGTKTSAQAWVFEVSLTVVAA